MMERPELPSRNSMVKRLVGGWGMTENSTGSWCRAEDVLDLEKYMDDLEAENKRLRGSLEHACTVIQAPQDYNGPMVLEMWRATLGGIG